MEINEMQNNKYKTRKNYVNWKRRDEYICDSRIVKRYQSFFCV